MNNDNNSKLDEKFTPPFSPVPDDSFLPPPIPKKADDTIHSDESQKEIEVSDNKHFKHQKRAIILSIAVACSICLAGIVIPLIVQNQTATEEHFNSIPSEYNSASNNICINDALLATFELTYGDLKAQYGEPTYSYWDGGGAYYTFDTRFGSVSYGFSEPSGDEPSYNTLPCALATTADVLFNNFGDGKTVSAISTAVGTSLDIDYDEGDSCQTADFNYNGMTIYIDMDDSHELISTNAGVWVKNTKYNY